MRSIADISALFSKKFKSSSFKIKCSGLTLKFTELGTHAFEELILECRKIYSAWLYPDGFGDVPKKEYSNRPLHEEFVGEIVNAWIKE